MHIQSSKNHGKVDTNHVHWMRRDSETFHIRINLTFDFKLFHRNRNFFLLAFATSE